jgi:CRISPR/Cas system-associated exonuclease Cas4 (RecB family)
MMPFLANIADRLLAAYPHGLEGVSIVLPSRRAIVFFKHYLSERIEKAIWLPRFYSIEDFIAEQSGLKVLDNLSLQFRLYQVYKEHTAEEEQDSLEDFLKWSQTLLYDFNEIDRYLVDAKKLLTNLTGLKEMEQWSLGEPELTPFQEKYVRFFEHIYLWYTAYQQDLLEEGLAYQGLAYRQAAERISESAIEADKVWFVGLNALTAAEKKIIDHLVQQGKAELFWDADAHYMDDEEQEAGLFLREHFKQWGEQPISRYLSAEKEVQIIGCARQVGQAKVAGDLLDKLSPKDLEGSQTALVMADEQLLFPVLNNLPKDLAAVNITMGAPLNTSPLFSLIDRLFKLQIHRTQYQQQGFYYKDVEQLLRHPYLNVLLDKAMCHELYRQMIKRNIVFVSATYLASMLDGQYQASWKQLEQLLQPWSTAAEAMQCIKQLLLSYKELVIEEQASVESEVLFSFYTQLQILENQLEILSEPPTVKTLQTVFYQLIGKASIPFRGEPLKGLQMMGVLETRTLDFKNVILLGVNEEKLPAGKSANSFIPFVLKKFFKMPTHEERDAVFAYHFYRLLQRAEKVALVYNTQNDDFGSGEKSRFLIQLEHELSHWNMEEKLLVNPLIEKETTGISIAKTAEVYERLEEWMANGISPSALNTYINCPLQFYFRYVARIREEEEVEEFIESSSFGSLMHDALEKAYEPYIGKALSTADLHLIEEAAQDLMKVAFEEQFGERIQYGKNHLIWKVAQQLLTAYFQVEKAALATMSEAAVEWRVLEVEKELSYEEQFEGRNIQWKGKVDRLDLCGKEYRIIDYKTGKVEKRELNFKTVSELFDNPKKSKALQLMMYAYLYLKQREGEHVIAANYSFKNIKEGLISLNKPLDAALILDFEQELHALLSSLLDQEQSFEQTDKLSACLYCDFKQLCGR